MKLGHFEFDPASDRLGEGPLSEVFRARDTRLDREVALKVLRPTAEIDPMGDQRFEREGRVLARLAHPNITEVYELGTDETDRGDVREYIAMELLHGHTLEDLLRERLLGIDECVRIAIQVAAAVAEVHRMDLVHRDLKPANVFVTPDGRVKLLDFGIARAKNETGLTQEGMMVGTVLFMSPEQVRGEDLAPTADVFSLGATLYNLFTGEFPYPGRSFPEVCMAILDGRPAVLPSQARPGLPGEVEEFLLRCLELRPEDRFQNGREVLAGLSHVQSRLEGVSIRPQLEGVVAVPMLGGPAAQTHPGLANAIWKELIDALGRNRGLEVLAGRANADNRADAEVRLGLELDEREGRLAVQLTHLSWQHGERHESEPRSGSAVEAIETGDADLVALQQDLAFAGARTIRRMLGSAPRRTPGASRVEQAQRAEALVQSARSRLHEGTHRALTRALLMLRNAVELDRYSARAHAQLAEAMVYKFLHYDGDEEHLIESRRSSARALELDSRCALAHVALGFGYHLTGRTADAAREYRLALGIDQEEWFAHRLLGALQKNQGNFTSARSHLERAVNLNRHQIGAYDHLWLTLVRLDLREKADEVAVRGVDAAEERLAEVPSDLDAQLHMALLQARLGAADRAREAVQGAREAAPKDGFVAFHAGLVAAVLGDEAEAVRHLQRALDRGYFVASEIAHNPQFDGLRGRRDFQELTT